MRDELKFESSAGIGLKDISLGQKVLAMVISVAVTALLLVLPLIAL